MTKEDDMKRWFAASMLAAVLAALTWATFASADPPAIPPNWHVHDVVPGGVVTDQHKPISFFPAILTAGDVALYLQDPAYCPNATDKGLLPSEETSNSEVLRAGVCQTSTKIIHLRTVPVGTSGPEGWAERSGPAAGYVTYYLITSR
jgi:hypothetical protein